MLFHSLLRFSLKEKEIYISDLECTVKSPIPSNDLLVCNKTTANA